LEREYRRVLAHDQADPKCLDLSTASRRFASGILLRLPANSVPFKSERVWVMFGSSQVLLVTVDGRRERVRDPTIPAKAP
jgi:hypothetical protein